MRDSKVIRWIVAIVTGVPESSGVSKFPLTRRKNRWLAAVAVLVLGLLIVVIARTLAH